MSDVEEPPLILTFEDFVEVLRRWDAYAFLEISEMSRGFPVTTSDNFSPRDVAQAVGVELSELGGLLWESLKAGPQEIDRIHDEHFAEEQAKFFRECYGSVEEITRSISNYVERLKPPMEMFVKLGKPAQMLLVRDGILQTAVENYSQAEEERDRAEEAEARSRRAQAEHERRVNRNAKLIRELDKSRCVFCGKEVLSHLRYVRVAEGVYEVIERRDLPGEEGVEAELLLACRACAAAVQGKRTDEAGVTPTYGRFAMRSGGEQLTPSENG